MIVTFFILILIDRYGLWIVAHINRVCPELYFFLKFTSFFFFFALIERSDSQNKYLFKKYCHKQTMLRLILVSVFLFVCIHYCKEKTMYVNAISCLDSYNSMANVGKVLMFLCSFWIVFKLCISSLYILSLMCCFYKSKCLTCFIFHYFYFEIINCGC